jgi:hypothetical protein
LIVLAMSLINTATKHWSTHEGAVRWLLFAAEILSVLKSAGAPAGKLGNLKAPGTVIGSNNIFPAVLALMIVSQGCALGPVAAIDKSVKAVQLAGELVMPIIHTQCMAEAKACQSAGDKTCQAWETCNGNREIFRLSLDATQEGLAKCALIAEQVCKKGGCK